MVLSAAYQAGMTSAQQFPIMAQTYEFTRDRARQTRHTQEIIQAKWLWSDVSLEQWDASIAALEAQNNKVAAARADMLAKRAAADAALDKLHDWTGEGLTLLRLRLRNDPDQLASLATLNADG